ncbi:HlyD family type I secretion periplasmic adaptor subunit [Ideonella azotifigens]|uniref:Membrane fusion protein (MFP) family protein n=1 Tax=Ideonella azotifigens TaxID=513160 RepID=A0ABN1JTQ9_9BURK|nr:HlyD family type I secretion periplasmic adaptor subunit [Ideonella azotifigens]MCD2341043.1 HlyD family type I secretion periplasmic adaptor subunit [Ideonella azotifigens]
MSLSKRSWHATDEGGEGRIDPTGLVHAADLPLQPGAKPPKPSLMQRWRKTSEEREQRRLKPGDVQFLSSVREAQVLESRTGAGAAIWLMLATVVAAGTWASMTKVEEITRTDARVVPDGREQVIASLEGGILRELMVKEGSEVKIGQPLARLDPTRFESQQNEGEVKQLALQATMVRLRAEASGANSLNFPPELAAKPKLVSIEIEAFNARKQLLNEAVASYQRSIGLVQKELNMAESMSARGLMSEVEVMRLRRQIGEMQQQSTERRSRFRQEASTEMLRVQSDLAQIEQQMVAREDMVRRTVIESPVVGLVKNIRNNTLGGVVNPGAAIMEIVPLTSRMLVEARIKPSEIGFVKVGQVAEIKLSAYDYNLYGGLRGTVDSISPDALGDAERNNGGPDNTYFRALVRVDHSSLEAGGKALPVRPGMTATVEINTGERTVLEFVLRPLLKAREAFKER